MTSNEVNLTINQKSNKTKRMRMMRASRLCLDESILRFRELCVVIYFCF